jgi:hypothetical protein
VQVSLKIVQQVQMLVKLAVVMLELGHNAMLHAEYNRVTTLVAQRQMYPAYTS